MYNNQHSSNLGNTQLHKENYNVQESYTLDLRPEGAPVCPRQQHRCHAGQQLIRAAGGVSSFQ